MRKMTIYCNTDWWERLELRVLANDARSIHRLRIGRELADLIIRMARWIARLVVMKVSLALRSAIESRIKSQPKRSSRRYQARNLRLQRRLRLSKRQLLPSNLLLNWSLCQSNLWSKLHRWVLLSPRKWLKPQVKASSNQLKTRQKFSQSLTLEPRACLTINLCP